MKKKKKEMVSQSQPSDKNGMPSPCPPKIGFFPQLHVHCRPGPFGISSGICSRIHEINRDKGYM